MNLKGVVHFTIPVKDARRSEAFYRDILGMTVVSRMPDSAPFGMVFLRCGLDYVVLTDSKTPLNVSSEDDMLLHHAFAVESEQFEATLAELERNGVRVFVKDERDHGVFVGRSAYFHDPDRNVLEIIDIKATSVRPLS